MRTDSLRVETKGGDTTAFVARPDDDTDRAVVVIQEYWGLNDHIKDVTGRYADEGFIAFAPDLYRGNIAKNPNEASKMMQDLAIKDGIDTIAQTLSKAREAYGISHFGITGYCMGGTFALRAACELEGLSAAVPFYGDIPDNEVLSKLRTPTIFISGTRDGWITPEKPTTALRPSSPLKRGRASCASACPQTQAKLSCASQVAFIGAARPPHDAKSCGGRDGDEDQ